ncbi:MAG: acetylglutamate kinase [Gemmataceae bacterium]
MLRESAESVILAAAHSRRLAGRPIVVKLGGSAMEDPTATAGVLDACLALQTIGIRLIVVHGGGKPIDRAMADAGLAPKKVQGIRYTDDATLEIVVRTLLKINGELRTQYAGRGGIVGGFVGEPGVWPIHGERMTLNGADLGHVGRVTKIEDAIRDHLAYEAMPILPSLAVGPDGNWLNVNADSVASAIGGALQADSVLFLTDTPGVLKDRANPESLVPHLTVSEARTWIAEGIIAGGMIPKVEACFEALAAGAKRAVIIDGRVPHTLIALFSSDRPYGTAIVP